MIRSSVTVSLVPEARGGPFVFWEDLPYACRRAAELGFDGIEIFPPSADEILQHAPLLSDSGLRVAAVGSGAGWVRHRWTLVAAETESRQRAIDFCKRLIDAAGRFQAPVIIGSMQGRVEPADDRARVMARLCDALRELAEHALAYHVPLLYEPLNRYETNLVHTLSAGRLLIETYELANVRLLADLFHMNIEEVNLSEALRANLECVGHIHFVDSNRRPAGGGHTDFAPLAQALRAAPYDGFLSAEALPYPDSERAASATIHQFRQLFR